MIFVTVGTHEQPFERLVRYMDNLAKERIIEEEIIIQTGYSTYEPKYVIWQKFCSYQQMRKYVQDARIVITHGGPSSFIMPLQVGKTPIVVPRRKEFGEHVNEHQVDFCNSIAERMGTIIVVEEIEKLSDIIAKYGELSAKLCNGVKSNNAKFCLEFEKIVYDIVRI